MFFCEVLEQLPKSAKLQQPSFPFVLDVLSLRAKEHEVISPLLSQATQEPSHHTITVLYGTVFL